MSKQRDHKLRCHLESPNRCELYLTFGNTQCNNLQWLSQVQSCLRGCFFWYIDTHIRIYRYMICIAKMGPGVRRLHTSECTGALYLVRGWNELITNIFRLLISLWDSCFKYANSSVHYINRVCFDRLRVKWTRYPICPSLQFLSQGCVGCFSQ